jgi:lysophospholipase L1-like esterase
MRIRYSTRGAVAIVAIFLVATAQIASAERWVGSWAASQQIPEPRNALAPEDLTDTTLRQVVRISGGGSRIRLRLSNAFGTAPLRFEAVGIARSLGAGSPAIDPESRRTVTFDGVPFVEIPAGALYVSDPIDLAVRPRESLAISFHIRKAPERQTGHPGSRTTTYIAKGNQVGATDLAGAKTMERWYHIAGVDVLADDRAAAIAVLGDSITDGNGSTTNRNDRWPDVLAERLQASPEHRHLSVLNHGIGGNRLLLDELGPNALARLERDVLAQPGVRYLIVLEGVNDLGTLTRDAPATPEARSELVRRMIGAYRQIVTRSRSHGIKAIGATILPYGASDYYHPDANAEADRQAINAWIRTPGNFDAVIDFDALMRDPARPSRMRKGYDKGDGLHPSAAGYRAMGEAVPLSLFD